MPQVPNYSAPQVSAEGTPGRPRPIQSPLSSVDFGTIGAQEEDQLGKGLQDAGATGDQIATAMQNQANQVRVTDAINQARTQAQTLTFDPQVGYLNQKGAAALDRASGQPLSQEYTGKLSDAISDIAQGLGNDDQRRMFAQQSGQLLTQFNGDVQKHQLSEFKDYSLSVQNGAIALSSNDAKLNWNDPTKIDQNVATIRAAAYTKGQMNGESADQIQAETQQLTSNMHLGVLDAALQNNNPTYANLYLQKYKGDMTADDLLKATGAINRTTDAQVSATAVDSATKILTPNLQPSDFDRLHTLVLGQESGNRDFNADGSPVTSPKGAKYASQVMPATAANPGFGIQPAQSDTPAEYNRVGTQLLQALITKYGNVNQALAAYNAGPGAVDKALATAKTNADKNDGSPTSWLSLLPQETQQYVASIGGKFNAGVGAPARPTELDFVNTAIAQLGPNPRPEQVALTREHAQQQFGVINKSLNEQGDQVLMQAQQALIANGGDFANLDSQIKSNLARLDPGKYTAAEQFAKGIAKGPNESDPAAYTALATYPEEMAKMSDAQFLQLKPQLSDADFKHFARERADILNGVGDTSAGSINTKAFNTELNERLTNLGINPTPAKTDLDSLARIGTIQKYARDDIFTQQQQLGRKMSPSEISDRIDTLFAKDDTFKSTFLGIPTGTSTKPMLSMTADDIPSDVKTSLANAFAARGIAKPTDGDLLRAYWNFKGAQKPSAQAGAQPNGG